MEDLRCSSNIIHEDIVEKVKDEMLGEDRFLDLGDFFKLFADPTRLKILYALSKEEMCVCDISALLQMSQSAISHQLKVLRLGRVVKTRKEGKVVYYSLDDDHIDKVLKQGLEHILEK